MINSQVLIIHKFPILFNILNEINYYLNFKLEKINDAKFIDDLNNAFQKFKKLSQHNIGVLINGNGKFYEYKDYKI